MKKVRIVWMIFLLCFSLCYFCIEARSSDYSRLERLSLRKHSQLAMVPPRSVTANALSPTSVRVTWQDSSLAENGFNVYQQGIIRPVATTGSGAGTGKTMSADILGLSCGVTYNFFVRAYSLGKESLDSNIATIKTSCLAPPQQVYASAQSQTSVVVKWTDNNTDEKGYRVYRPRPLNPPVLLKTTGAYPSTGSPVSVSFNNKECSTTYKFFVRSFNDDGESADSPEVSVTTHPCPYKTVEVQFTSIHVLNDTDPLGTGELWFDFLVGVPYGGGKTLRHPISGTISISDNQSETIALYSSLDLPRDQKLGISVTGTDDDAPLSNESLGTATEEKWVSALKPDFESFSMSCIKDGIEYYRVYFKVRARDKKNSLDN